MHMNRWEYCNIMFEFVSDVLFGLKDWFFWFFVGLKDSGSSALNVFLLSCVNRPLIDPESLTLRKQPRLIKTLLSFIFSSLHSVCDLPRTLSEHSQSFIISKIAYISFFQGDIHPGTRCCRGGRNRLRDSTDMLAALWHSLYSAASS